MLAGPFVLCLYSIKSHIPKARIVLSENIFSSQQRNVMKEISAPRDSSFGTNTRNKLSVSSVKSIVGYDDIPRTQSKHKVAKNGKKIWQKNGGAENENSYVVVTGTVAGENVLAFKGAKKYTPHAHDQHKHKDKYYSADLHMETPVTMPSNLEELVLGRATRQACTLDTYTEEAAKDGEWVPISSKSNRKGQDTPGHNIKWASPKTRNLYLNYLKMCYSSLGLGHVSFCTVPMDETPVRIYIPNQCALPNFDPDTLKGRRIFMVGDSVTRAVTIALMTSLSEVWGTPYDVIGARKMGKALRSFCLGWKDTATMLCWVSLKKQVVTNVMNEVLAAAEGEDIVIVNIGLHYRLNKKKFQDSVDQLSDRLMKIDYTKPTPLIAFAETTPQFFHRGFYTDDKDYVKGIQNAGGNYDICHRLNETANPGLHPLANQYNEMAFPTIHKLQSRKKLGILPLWHAFAALGPVDVLGRRLNDGKLDCTHSCLLRERHIYRIQMLQMLTTSHRKITDNQFAARKKNFVSQWNVIRTVLFNRQESESYVDVLSQQHPTLIDGTHINDSCLN
eukprot:CFRG0727T1